MKSYYLLYLPALVFFFLPVVNLLYQSRKASAAKRAKEEQRCAAAELKQAEKEVRQKKRERAAKPETGKSAAGSVEKHKPGRPRKNPPVERLEIISIEQYQPAPDRAETAPDQQPAKVAALPTSCTLEQFAAWIG